MSLNDFTTAVSTVKSVISPSGLSGDSATVSLDWAGLFRMFSGGFASRSEIEKRKYAEISRRTHSH